ncbi:hypothetical protein M9H77_13084 [Catharanthus roseus]|uniref:Uncharacterized protein n=1 Tax=Catharanthus roseus TaxID=4058 RepID=A0ACC0BJB5_CATRO|nr:hypothetical protein M9H77_13084 [Catharanthus roseus]
MKKERSSHSKIKALKTLKTYVLVRDVLKQLSSSTRDASGTTPPVWCLFLSRRNGPSPESILPISWQKQKQPEHILNETNRSSERPLDVSLKAKVRQLQNKAVFFIDAERTFFAKKIKREFLLQGDKGTRLFHSLVKRNAIRNFIASITREDSTYTTNDMEVQDEFINFYGKLLDFELLDRWSRRFLWGGKSAKVAWQTLCQDKQSGGLGLRDSKKWNDALLSRAIWNINSKKDSLWSKWIQHYYVIFRTIWELTDRKDFPPLANCDVFNTVGTYAFMASNGQKQRWTKLLQNATFPPKFSFILWLAVLWRLPIMDRLTFIEADCTCKLCNHYEESISQLFFTCPFIGGIWQAIQEWAGLRRRMTTIQSCLKWLHKECRGTSWICNLRKLSFAATLYYLWEYRNKVVFEIYNPDRDHIIGKIKILVYKAWQKPTADGRLNPTISCTVP